MFFDSCAEMINIDLDREHFNPNRPVFSGHDDSSRWVFLNWDTYWRVVTCWSWYRWNLTYIDINITQQCLPCTSVLLTPYSEFWKAEVLKVPISLIFLSFRWKVEPFCNTKFQILNSFSRFLLVFWVWKRASKSVLGQLSFLTKHSFHYEVLVWWRRRRYLCSFRLNINIVNTTISSFTV